MASAATYLPMKPETPVIQTFRAAWGVTPVCRGRIAPLCRGLSPPSSADAPLYAANERHERFIKTALLEWAYARVYRHSDERRSALETWLHHYNWHRPHTSVGGRPPDHSDRPCARSGETPQLAKNQDKRVALVR